MSKRRCLFTNSIKKKFPFLNESHQHENEKVECMVCKAQFSVGRGGSSDVVNRIKPNKHKQEELQKFK
jgi:hypothetical protein